MTTLKSNLACKPSLVSRGENALNVAAYFINGPATLWHPSYEGLKNVPHAWPDLNLYLTTAGPDVINESR
jgi:hypothetical protein